MGLAALLYGADRWAAPDWRLRHAQLHARTMIVTRSLRLLRTYPCSFTGNRSFRASPWGRHARL